MVLIHGQVYHKSEKNTSSKPRHAYTFHMVETVGSKYAEKNWLQQTDEHSFPKLFAN
jgi:phytanoyl-CoA hydroxylase